MNEGVPAAVQLHVVDADVDSVRADFRWRRRRLSQPWMLVLGIPLVFMGLLRIREIHSVLDLWQLAFGVLYIGFAWIPTKNAPAVLRSSELQFSDTGLDVVVIFTGKGARRYLWRQIRAIDDIGECFVLVPKFGTRAVFPKRDFPDGGREAWAFFEQHGVAGRTPSVTAAPV